jgi:hypothetical protein
VALSEKLTMGLSVRPEGAEQDSPGQCPGRILIFSTKHRQPFVAAQIEPELHAYMAGILTEKPCPAITIGGMPDHVHVLFAL